MSFILFYLICIFHSTRMNLRAMIVCNQYGRTFKCCRFDEKIGNLNEGRVSEFYLNMGGFVKLLWKNSLQL